VADKRREGVRIRQGDTDFVVAPDPELEVIREVAKGRAYLQPGEKPPKGVAAHEGPRGGRYYEEGSRARTSPQTPQDSPRVAAESAREGVPEHRKPRLRDIQRTFAGVLRARGVTKDELGSVARAWFMKWDSDAGLLMVDILMGREAARAYLRTHQERLPPERADQYLNNLRTEDTWYSRDLRPGVLSAVRVASQTALREAGIDALPVYRGVSGEMARGLQEGQSYRPRPMESWTTKQSFAEKWAAMSPGEAGAVVKKTIPTDQVFLFSDAVPSLRRFGQHEVVVMRGKGETLRLSKGVMLAKKHGQEYSELDDLDQDIHPKNVGVRVGIPSYIAQAEGDVTPSEAIKPITPEEGTSEEGQETGYEGSEGGAETPHVGRATGSGSIPESKKIEKHLPGKHDQKKHGRVGAVDWLDPSEARDLYREILERVTRGDIPEFSNLGDGLLETIRDRLHTALAAMIRRAKKEGGYENFNAAVRIRDALFSVDGVLSQRAKDRSFSAKLEEQVGILTAGNSIDVRDDDARADLKQEIMERTAKGMERKLGVTPEQESENLDKLSYEAARFLNDYYEKVGSPVRISREGDNYRFRGGNRDELTGVRQTLTMALAEGWADAEDKMAKAAPFWAAARTLAPHFRDVYDQAKGVELSSSERVAYYLTKTWAISSSDHRAPSVALQRVASEAFGVEDTTVAYVEQGFEDIDRIVSKHGQVLRAWVDSVYEDTQALLKELEMDEVVLVRGMGWDEAAKIPDWVSALPEDEPTRTRAKLNPLSSFASEYSVAIRFATRHEEEQMLVAARVPRDKIFSTFRTGPGCAEEYEMLVIGGEIDVVARRAGGQELPAWEERAEQDMRHHNIELAAQEAVWLDEDMHNADWTKQTHDVFALQPASGVEKLFKGAPTEPMDSRAHTGNAPETTTGIVTTNQGVAGSQDVQDSRNAPITLAEIAHAEMLMRLAAMGINKMKTNAASDLPSRLDKRGKRRWPSPLERVNQEIGRTKKAMETATRALWRGEGDVDTWHAQMRAAVDDLYGKSAYASTLRLKETPDARQRARDNLMAELRHQRHYLSRFRDDIALGHVKTEKQAVWRAKLYADGSAGLYHQTVSEGSPQMKAHWKLTLGAEHCATCLEMATQSPWPANRMPRLPRDGSTICRSNCRCFLIYRKARPTFRPVRRKKTKKSPE